ncbi:YdbH domain-containing protein [Sphingomonas colocasiae]|uniref:YdbH domain-containing protein n=1 Tax=Sphingomonas colocasiae TaxID=1848973 RepID=A0ABS7PPQ0_9SPHN|nr:YdbH domain-containing protein [Sphingomonas colocasiae]
MNESEERAAAEVPKRRRARRVALATGAILLVAIALAWTQRKPIADSFVADALEQRGVSARYEIAEIGFRTQRLEKISIGDPAHPDLTADWAEILIAIRGGGPTVTGVRAGGVRLRGRLIDGTVSFGSIDRLLPAPSGKPFALPDLDLDLNDARMRLDLPNGPVGLKLDGRGNLTGGFRGKLAAVAPELTIGNCPLRGATAWLDLSVTDKAPHVVGPVRAAGFACPDAKLDLARPQARVDAVLNEALNRWKGAMQLDLPHATLGANRLDGVNGTVAFDGGRARTGGDLRIAAKALAVPGGSGQGLTLTGAYRIGNTPRGFQIGLGGKVAVDNAALDRATLARLASLGGTAKGTPVAPLAAALAEAAGRAGAGMRLSGDFTVAQLGDTGSLQLNALDAASRSGARLTMAGGVKIGWPAGLPQVNGRLNLVGGGFPQTVIDLAQPAAGAPIRGNATIAPFASGGARLALNRIDFTADPHGGTRFATRVTLDGPLADGRVTGLTLPLAGHIDARGGFALNPGCAPLGLTALKAAGLTLGATRLTLCPIEGQALFARSAGGGMSGGARIAAPRLSGRLGDSPIEIAAADARLALRAGTLGAQDVAIRLGAPDRATRLDIGILEGRIGGSGMAGRFDRLGGQIGNVPLIVSEAAGNWRFADGALKLDGRLRVADTASTPRFNPLISDDFNLSLIDGKIAASGLLREPAGRTPVTAVTIAHDLSAGTGQAVLDVPELRFGKTLQPDALTHLAFGVVANVDALVSGRGEIRWTPDGVTSDGVFRTSGASLAAAFGPVSNLSGEIRFTDLLGLVTAPGQSVSIGEVNPGLPVTNGVLRYHLLPNQQVAIEGGEWPFASGRLTLDPTILDLGAAKPRYLTFRVSGMDAAAFLQGFDFENINATGIFDGVLPIVFDEKGGRIVDGRLTVREGGGSLAYVGQLTQEDLGNWGNIAFQALRAVRYRSLEVILNGDLDGEMVTQVRFAGLGQGEGTKQNFITRKIAALPIRFNVTIRAPFRQLLFSARSLYDPTLLIEQNLPALLDAQKARTQTAPPQPTSPQPAPPQADSPPPRGQMAVQPPESENKR